MSAPGLPPRAAAAELLQGVLFHGKMLTEMTDDPKGPLADLPPQGRARAQSLTLNVLRNLGPLDTLLDQFLQKDPPMKVRNALRIAAAEVVLDGIPPHAAVDAAVRLVRSSQKTAHLSGLTNAVARRAAAAGPEIWPELDPQPMPDWLAQQVVTAYGTEANDAIAAAHAMGAPLDLSLRDKAELALWAERLEAEVLPAGSLRIARPGQVSALPGYDEGAWWVQDAAAALPVRLLGDVKGLRVLDLCAAPGGKTLQLAAAGADVTALDISRPRLKRMQENLNRTGLNAAIVAADVMRWTPDAPYDVVVLDAPCSATGTLRRHPDLPFVRGAEDIAALVSLQSRMLARAADWLAPSGRLLYCTCSLLPSEGEERISTFMGNNTVLQRIVPVLPEGCDPRWMDAAGGLRLRPDFWPDHGGMDGFFATVLQMR